MKVGEAYDLAEKIQVEKISIGTKIAFGNQVKLDNLRKVLKRSDYQII